MPAIIQVVGMRQKVDTTGAYVVNTCSNSAISWQRGLSPFLLGPCHLFDGYMAHNMENAWQFTKLYRQHAHEDGTPTKDWWDWAINGWNEERAIRYPMGRGARPLHAWWDGEPLGYIEARKRIYGPLYKEAVEKSPAWTVLQQLYAIKQKLILRDFDGYDYTKKKMALTDVLNEPKRKMGHSFVLTMMLLNDPALQQMDLR